MQNRSYSDNYSTYSTQSQRKRTKQRRSIFDIPEPVEPQRIRRIKIRREAAANYRNRIRDIYHQTDYLANWKDEDLPCLIRPIEKTGLGSFLEKSKRSIYSKYQDISMRQNGIGEETDFGPNGTEFENPTNNFDENSNLLNNQEPDQTQQAQQFDEMNQEEEQFDEMNQEEEQFDEMNQEEEQIDYEQEEESWPANPENTNQNYIDNEEEEEAEINIDINVEDTSEIDFPQQEEEDIDNFENQQFADEQDLIPDNYDNFKEENDDINNTNQFSEIEEEEEDYDETQSEPALDNSNIEIVLYGVANVSTTMENSHLFITFQQIDVTEYSNSKPIRVDKPITNHCTPVNLGNVHKLDILEILVWEENDENSPVLLGGLRIPLQSIDWRNENIQTFDLLSPQDLDEGLNVPSADYGNIALEFKIQ